MVELDDGRILCLYYKEHNQGQSSKIWQVIFRLADGPKLLFEEQ